MIAAERIEEAAYGVMFRAGIEIPEDYETGLRELAKSKDAATRRFVGERPPVPLRTVASTRRAILRQAQDEERVDRGLVPATGWNANPLCFCASVVNLPALTAEGNGGCSC